ncbi:hypothetical protein KFE94_16195 [bacterium SCSIO 12643]|nr:hypothetical protein KFE94_16195 [bacterium SCSIO 12643]
MKKIVLILIILSPYLVYAKHNSWGFKDVTLQVGQQFNIQERTLWSFEIQFDKYTRSSLTRLPYWGFGILYNHSESQTEFGIKGILNPVRYSLTRGNSTYFIPYVYGQGNYVQTKSMNSEDEVFLNNSNFRTGVGVTGKFRSNQALFITSTAQLGYNFYFEDKIEDRASFVFEFRIGVGIDIGYLKRKKHLKE